MIRFLISRSAVGLVDLFEQSLPESSRVNLTDDLEDLLFAGCAVRQVVQDEKFVHSILLFVVVAISLALLAMALFSSLLDCGGCC